MRPQDREWQEANSLLDRMMAGHEGHYDALAKEFEAQERESGQRLKKTNETINDLFRRSNGEEERPPDVG